MLPLWTLPDMQKSRMVTGHQCQTTRVSWVTGVLLKDENVTTILEGLKMIAPDTPV
ncbi:MAG: hypothetical protein ACLUE2_06685 [Bacteroides cellulosilyticus]